jgi:hypothetical protein
MSAGRYNMIVEQGALYYRTFSLKTRFGEPYDLSNVVEARGQIRRHAAQAEPTAVIDVEITNATEGTFVISLDDSITSTIPAYPHKYDIEFDFDEGDTEDSTDDTKTSPRTTRMLFGDVDVRANITR